MLTTWWRTSTSQRRWASSLRRAPLGPSSSSLRRPRRRWRSTLNPKWPVISLEMSIECDRPLPGLQSTCEHIYISASLRSYRNRYANRMSLCLKIQISESINLQLGAKSLYKWWFNALWRTRRRSSSLPNSWWLCVIVFFVLDMYIAQDCFVLPEHV